MKYSNKYWPINNFFKFCAYVVVEGIRQVVIEVRFHLRTLRQQLFMPTLGHLSPIVIDPENLRKLFTEIGAELPSIFKLLANINAENWEYYQFLSVNTIMGDGHRLVITSIS